MQIRRKALKNFKEGLLHDEYPMSHFDMAYCLKNGDITDMALRSLKKLQKKRLKRFKKNLSQLSAVLPKYVHVHDVEKDQMKTVDWYVVCNDLADDLKKRLSAIYDSSDMSNALKLSHIMNIMREVYSTSHIYFAVGAMLAVEIEEYLRGGKIVLDQDRMSSRARI